ncbi:hypothetical protein ACUXZZ_38700 [Streptomyces graminifolii]|uniref:hypothetical protein n=1 Tax=Streptomyces graminifolii TaxID=1266771 RepID=UPI00405991E4
MGVGVARRGFSYFGAKAHRYEPMPSAVPRADAGEERAAGGEWERNLLPDRFAAAFPLTGPRPDRIGSSAHGLTPDMLMPADEGCGVFRG